MGYGRVSPPFFFSIVTRGLLFSFALYAPHAFAQRYFPTSVHEKPEVAVRNFPSSIVFFLFYAAVPDGWFFFLKPPYGCRRLIPFLIISSLRSGPRARDLRRFLFPF